MAKQPAGTRFTHHDLHNAFRSERIGHKQRLGSAISDHQHPQTRRGFVQLGVGADAGAVRVVPTSDFVFAPAPLNSVLGLRTAMINQSDNPVPWALLLYEIDEVRDHLDSLAKQMASAGRIDNEDFGVQIGHAYAHLNRIWHRRNEKSEEITGEQWDAFSKFPTDIDPVG